MRGSIQSLGDVPYTLSGTRLWTGTQTFNSSIIVNGTAGSGATSQFKAVSGQSGALIELYNSSGIRVAYFDQSGNFTSTGAVSYASTQVSQSNGTTIGFSVKGFSGATADLQQWQNSGGTALSGVDNSGNLYTTAGNITIGGTFITTAGSYAPPSLSGHGGGLKISLFGALPANDKDANALGIEGGAMWLNAAGGGINFYSAGVLNTRLSPPGATQRSASANIQILRPTMSGGGDGIRFTSSSGGTFDQSIIQISGSEDLVIGTDNGAYLETVRFKSNNFFQTASGTNLNLPQTNSDYLSPGASVSIYTNTASSGASAGRLTFTSNGSTGTDGTYIEYVPPTAGNTSKALHITGDMTGPLDNFFLNAKAITLGQNTPSGSGLMIRGDSWNADPGIPWIRSDNTGDIFINAHGSGNVYLAWDKISTTFFGGPVTFSAIGRLNFEGATTTTAAVSDSGQRLGIVVDGSNYWLVLSS